MLPMTLSASALKVAVACLSRYEAEHFKRGAGMSGSAANLGTTLHSALESFIIGFKIKKDMKWNVETLLELFDKSFTENFGPDFTVPEYKDGRQILVSWFHRPSTFETIIPAQVLSVETKNNFPLKVFYNGQWVVIPFNYIFDRLDRIGDGEYRVVDYKSNRMSLTVDELRDNIQARAYAIAVATKYSDAKRIWVQFDFLRHESIGVVFTREDNVASYRMLQRIAQRIVDQDPNEKTPETLNPECLWCIRKATCETLASNVDVGGILAIDANEAAVKYHDIKAKAKALDLLVSDLEKYLILHAASLGETDFETEDTQVRVFSGMRRKVDIEKVAQIVGPRIMQQYNGVIRVTDLDSLYNHPELTPGQKAAIRASITKVPGNPSVKVTKKK